jgi:epoxyqueuosine reductase
MKNLLSELKKHGYAGRIVPVFRVGELKEEIERRRREGQFDREFYEERLTWHNFNPEQSLPGAKSMIVVSVAQPQIQVVFNRDGKSWPLIIPPTYLHYPDELVKRLLTKILRPSGYRIAPASVPQKLLAARTGLAAYGKNNICYIPGMGSFHRPVAFYSDFPCPDDTWQEAQMLERCKKCTACLRSCPTGAITAERFPLRAELCLTFHNERAADFPSWIDPSWHHCLVGCLYCQKVCPENKKFMKWVEKKGEFSEEETCLILEKVEFGRLPAQTQQKLEGLDLIEYAEILPRNLSALFDKPTVPIQ